MARGGRRPNGFTLLEIVVALAVVGLVLAALAQGMHFGRLAWTNDSRLVNRDDDLSALDEVLRHLIEGANPGDDAGPAPFLGDTDRLEFITGPSNVRTAAPTRRVEAILQVDADRRLVLRWRPYLHALHLGPPQRFTDTELLRGVSRIELSFWRADTGWAGTWTFPDLPRLVRIRLLFPEGDPRHWPPSSPPRCSVRHDARSWPSARVRPAGRSVDGVPAGPPGHADPLDQPPTHANRQPGAGRGGS